MVNIHNYRQISMLPVGAVVVLGMPRRVVPVVPVGVGLVIGAVGPGI